MKERTIYALGFFDGVHLGHQALLSACHALAQEHSCKTGVVTFSIHPDGLVSGKAPALLNTIEDRRRLLCAFGMDSVVELPFDNALMQMPWQEFIRMLRSEPYNAAGFVCGNDFRFGFKGEGTAQILQQYCAAENMPCAVVPQQELDGIRVSSTHIRTLMEQGEFAQVNRFLGHAHILSGEVVQGRGLGHTMGIPTANILLPAGLIAPKQGVYACKATVDGAEYLAVTNIGSRPTVGGHQVRAESWLLDFAGDLYGKQLTLAFYEHLRPEQKFADLEELQAEILKNADQTRKMLEKS